VSVYFLEKGVHVLCEKPMANTLAECDRMIEAAKRSKAKLAIGHVQKYYTAAEEVKKIIESKRFGELVMIHETRTKDYLNNRPAWFLSKKTAGGGIAMNLGAHSLDRILFTTGLAVENVYGIASNPVSNDDIETTAHFLIGLSGGVSATITLCGTHVPQTHDTIYYFTNGIVKIEGRDLFIYENGEFVNCGGEYNLIVRQLAEFVKLIRGEESAACTPEYGREIIRVLKEVI
jgi:predicted dehydrogenase